MNKIAGVIVTFNRKDELIKNIQACNAQKRKVDTLYVIDNDSTDGTRGLLEQMGYLNNPGVCYVKLDHNIGGAGGFYEGMKRAYTDGFDFIILMDDDGRPANEFSFQFLIEKSESLIKENDKLMINSIVVDDSLSKLSFGMCDKDTIEEIRTISSDGLLRDSINPFNGTLVSKGLIIAIGFPNKDFFIRGDEIDYQARAQRSGALIATVVDSIYFHPPALKNRVNYFGTTVVFEKCTPIKSYYLTRNYVYITRRDKGIISAIRLAFMHEYCTRKSGKDLKSNIPYIRKGVLDGIRGKLGKRDFDNR